MIIKNIADTCVADRRNTASVARNGCEWQDVGGAGFPQPAIQRVVALQGYSSTSIGR